MSRTDAAQGFSPAPPTAPPRRLPPGRPVVRAGHPRGAAARPHELTLRLRLPQPSRGAIRGLARWLQRVDALAPTLPAPRWAFLLLTPLGASYRAWLAAELVRLGVGVRGVLPLQDWPRISSAVQVRRRGLRALRTGALYAAAWEQLFGHGAAEAWAIAPAQLEPLARLKASLRAALPTMLLDVRPRKRRPLALHPFHLADPGDGPDEARRLEAAVRLLGRRWTL